LKGLKQEKHKYLYWEFPEYGGQQAVIIGKWKALRKNMHKGNTTWELYNLETDLAETSDVAGSNPAIIAEVEKIVHKEHVKSGNQNWWFNVLGDK
jgi:arylsulfatase